MLTPALDALLAQPVTPGAGVSVWLGPTAGEPWFTSESDALHYAASTMKIALAVRVEQLIDAGTDPGTALPVHDEFDSAVPGARFTTHRDYDNDEEPWHLLGGTAPLRWLTTRAMVRSSNLATNLLLERVGASEVELAWRALGATSATVRRGIEDAPAAGADCSNLVTAHDLAVLLQAIAEGRAASRRGCEALLDDLFAQEYRDTIPAGLPADVRVGHKSGWVDGIAHDAAIIETPDGTRFVLVICTSTDLSEEAGQRFVATVAEAAWSDWTKATGEEG